MFATTAPQDLLGPIGIEATWLEIGVAILILLGAIASGVRLLAWGLDRAVSGVRAARGGQEYRKRRYLRMLFARHVSGRISDIDNQEEWADHRFTELEAEVETLGGTDALPRRALSLRRRQRGLRRERSLSRALRKSGDQLVLLQGDPGSGKSVALRFVARRMAEEAANGKRGDAVIPLYVNLKNLRAEDRPVDARLIEDFVVRHLSEGTNRDVHRFLENEFARGKREGTWLFLFDSFDEIPAVLGATDADETVKAYSDAIFGFMHGMNTCRGVIASRSFRSPSRYGLPRFRIVPLSERRKRQLVRKAGLRPEQVKLATELPDATPDVVALSSNPLFLGLLCDHVKETDALPEGWHDVFDSYVSRRIATDADKVERLFGITGNELRQIAEEIAFTMTASELGLSPSRSTLVAAYDRFGFQADRAHVDVALSALEWIKLARSEHDRPSATDPSFTFAHRRFQEYFATSVVLRDVTRVPPVELLTNASWRETAVTLFQAGHGTDALLRAADDLLETAEVETRDSSAPFAWAPGTVHVLGVLQSGFAGRGEHLPDDLRDRVWSIVSRAYLNGDLLDRKWALEVAGSADPEGLAKLLRHALQGDSEWLREVAFRQAARLPRVPDDVGIDVRIALARSMPYRRLLFDWLGVKAQLLRLSPPAPFLGAARLLRVSPIVDLMIVVTLVVMAFFVAAATGTSHAFLLTVAVAAVIGRPRLALVDWLEPSKGDVGVATPVARPSARRPSILSVAAGLDRWSDFTNSDTGQQIRDYLLTMGMMLGAVARSVLLVLAVWAAGDMPVVEGVALVAVAGYAAVWEMAAVHVSVSRPPRSPLSWPFVVIAAAGQVARRSVRGAAAFHWSTVKSTLPVFAVIGVDVALLPEVDLLDWFSKAVGGVFVLALSIYAIVHARLRLQDWLWMRRWRGSRLSNVTADGLIELLGEVRTSAAATRLLRHVRTRRLVHDDSTASSTLRELLQAMDSADHDAMQPSSAAVRGWLQADGDDHRPPLGSFSSSVRDELGQLLEEVQHGAELPSA